MKLKDSPEKKEKRKNHPECPSLRKKKEKENPDPKKK